jgi:ketosteroid isomerase-like protein
VSPRETIARFYDAFAQKDHAVMASCYAENAQFSDPVFQDLRGWKIGAMWRMLCERGTDLKIRSSNVRAEGTSGSAHWDADYTFSVTNRMVHNSIDASFRFDGDKIVEHRDVFDFYKWTRMALGAPGVLLGWTPIIQNKVRRTANGNLESFIKKNYPGR